MANQLLLEDYMERIAIAVEKNAGLDEEDNIAKHNAHPRNKFLGNAITAEQNQAIKDRTYTDLYVGNYWTVDGVNWRIAAVDYYWRCGDREFNKGNIIVVPDVNLYNAQMNTSNTTSGGYANSTMRKTNLASAKAAAQAAFGSHVASHRILMTTETDANGPSDWAWMDSDGVELMNEVQVYGTRVWGSALKPFDVGTQKTQLPLFAVAPQYINTRQDYWLQDISSHSVSSHFALVSGSGHAGDTNASYSLGVRPAITLSYI